MASNSSNWLEKQISTVKDPQRIILIAAIVSNKNRKLLEDSGLPLRHIDNLHSVLTD